MIWLGNTGVIDDHEYVSLVVTTIRFFPVIRAITNVMYHRVFQLQGVICRLFCGGMLIAPSCFFNSEVTAILFYGELWFVHSSSINDRKDQYNLFNDQNKDTRNLPYSNHKTENVKLLNYQNKRKTSSSAIYKIAYQKKPT